MRGLFDNPGLKAASLGFALVLWFVIAGEKLSEVGVSVPVELQNVPPDMELTGEPVSSLMVRLRGSRSIVQRLGPREVSAQIDLAGALEGEHIEHLTEDSIQVPFGVRVVKITPAIITLDLERTLQKTIPIRPRLLGKPAPGYEIAQTRCDPREVLIAGPTSRVREIQSAITEPVSVEGAQTSVVERVNVGLSDPVLRVHGSPRVRVTALIREAHEKRTFASLPVTARGGDTGLTPAKVDVVLSGPAEVLEGLDEAQLEAFVNVEPGAERLPVQLALPPGLSLSVHQIDPAEVDVRPRSR